MSVNFALYLLDTDVLHRRIVLKDPAVLAIYLISYVSTWRLSSLLDSQLVETLLSGFR